MCPAKRDVSVSGNQTKEPFFQKNGCQKKRQRVIRAGIAIKNNFSVETDSALLLVKCTEKPEVVIDNVKGTGFSIFNGKTQKLIKETYRLNAEKLYDLCDSFNFLVKSGYHGSALFVAEKEFNINTIADLTEAESYLK